MILPVAVLPVSPISWTRKLRHRYISGTAKKLLTAIQGVKRNPILGTKYI